MTANQINRFRALTDQQQALETKRHNIVTEGISQRDVASNEEYRRMSGSAALQQAAAARVQAGAAAQQARTAAERQAEDARHNQVSEDIQRADVETRSQVARESARHNLATEQQAAGFGALNVIETRRHNVQTEKASARQASAAEKSAQGSYLRGKAASDRTHAQNVRDYVSAGKTAAEIASMLINGGD